MCGARDVERSSLAKADREALRSHIARGRDTAGAVQFLREGKITACKVLPRGSNCTFLVSLSRRGDSARAVYKPRRGEAPLWDFPDGTLYLREYAAYLVSEALGWCLVPPTVVRDGPYGVGMVQWFVPARHGESYFSLTESHRLEFRRIAAFDWLVNNADRKAGHCLQGEDGRIWSIDHGLTFHQVPKLRTVIWDFAGERIPDDLLDDLKTLARRLAGKDGLCDELSDLLSESELEALRERLKGMLERPVFPTWSGSYRSVPWPPY